MIIMDNYETPFEVYEQICDSFKVYPTLDVCASKENKKCKEYYDCLVCHGVGFVNG